MSGWRRTYLANTLVRKYGILGKVASRYVLAGFSVRVFKDYILARGRGESRVVCVITNVKELSDKLPRVKELAKKLLSKPTLVVYGKCKIPDELIEKVTSEGVGIKFVRD